MVVERDLGMVLAVAATDEYPDDEVLVRRTDLGVHQPVDADSRVPVEGDQLSIDTMHEDPRVRDGDDETSDPRSASEQTENHA